MLSRTIDDLTLGTDTLEERLLSDLRRIKKALAKARKQLTGISEPNEIHKLDDEIVRLQWQIYEIVSRATRGLYSSQDISDWTAIHDEMQCSPPDFGAGTISKLVRLEIVPNATFRSTYLSSEMKANGLSVLATKVVEQLKAAGIEKDYSLLKGDGTADHTAMARILAIKPTERNGKRYARLFIPYALAVALADTLHIPYPCVGV